MILGVLLVAIASGGVIAALNWPAPSPAVDIAAEPIRPPAPMNSVPPAKTEVVRATVPRDESEARLQKAIVWLGAEIHVDDFELQFPVCSGLAIESRAVLVPAHWAVYLKGFTQAPQRVFCYSPMLGDKQLISVTEVRVHPDFRDNEIKAKTLRAFQSNLAVLELAESLPHSVSLPDKLDDQELTENREVFLFGYSMGKNTTPEPWSDDSIPTFHATTVKIRRRHQLESGAAAIPLLELAGNTPPRFDGAVVVDRYGVAVGLLQDTFATSVLQYSRISAVPR